MSEDEPVDIGFGPGGVFDFGRNLCFGGNERPEFFVFGSLDNPLLNEVFFGRGERFGVSVVGRHRVVLVHDADPCFGVIQRTGLDGRDAVLECVGSFRRIEAQTGLSVGLSLGIESFIGAMAGDAFGRKNGADVLIEGKLGLADRGGDKKRGKSEEWAGHQESIRGVSKLASLIWNTAVAMTLSKVERHVRFATGTPPALLV